MIGINGESGASTVSITCLLDWNNETYLLGGKNQRRYCKKSFVCSSVLKSSLLRLKTSVRDGNAFAVFSGMTFIATLGMCGLNVKKVLKYSRISAGIMSLVGLMNCSVG